MYLLSPRKQYHSFRSSRTVVNLIWRCLYSVVRTCRLLGRRSFPSVHGSGPVQSDPHPHLQANLVRHRSGQTLASHHQPLLYSLPCTLTFFPGPLIFTVTVAVSTSIRFLASYRLLAHRGLFLSLSLRSSLYTTKGNIDEGILTTYGLPSSQEPTSPI